MLNFIINHTPLFYLTQSIWRDEGFSYFMAKPGILQVIRNSINDFNPPLYYIVLHFWMKIFGETDVALRMLSFVFHVMTVYCVFLLAKKLWGEKFALYVAAFTFLNPVLIYYAFEIRMYSMFVFFTFASLYFFIEKRWHPYIVVATLGIYTHSFFIFVILSEIVYLFITKQSNKSVIIKTVKPVIFFIPWLPFLIWQFGQAKNTWIYPVDWQLVKSVLGNLFIGYEGTPGGVWGATTILSVIVLIFIYLSIKGRMKINQLFASLILVPLLIVIPYSVIRQPIYVNRYLIFVTVGEILAISSGIWSIRSRTIRKIWIGLWIGFVILVNLVSVQFHKKVDFRSTILEINKLARPSDFVYTQTPLSYFETTFYYPRKDRVFIYDPQNIAVPKYIGTAVIPKERVVLDFPEYPARVFFIHDNGSYEMVIKTVNTNLK